MSAEQAINEPKELSDARLERLVRGLTERRNYKRVHRLGNLDLTRNLATGEGVNKVGYTQTSTLYLRFMSPITSYTFCLRLHALSPMRTRNSVVAYYVAVTQLNPQLNEHKLRKIPQCPHIFST